MANINDVLEGHVALEIECVDRLYLNAYVPNLQVGGRVVRFLRDHLGNQIPSPALLGPIGNRFRRPMKVKGLGRTILGSDGSGSRSRGAEIASCGLGSARRARSPLVSARICAVVVIAGVDGVAVTG